MIPISIDPARVRIGLAGDGPQAARRLQILRNAGAEVLTFAGLPDEEDLKRLQLLWIVGLDRAAALALAGKARTLGLLVNVEDVREGCDFHNVAEIRRGDLLITVSTNGRSPGLAAIIRSRLAETYGPEWAARLGEVAAERDAARAEGRSMAQVAAETSLMVGAAGWLG